MELARGDIWWALLIVQSDVFNRSRLRTAIAVVLTRNVRLVEAPGNVLVPAKASGLPRDSVADAAQVITVDRAALTERVGHLPARLLDQVADGLRLTLSLYRRFLLPGLEEPRSHTTQAEEPTTSWPAPVRPGIPMPERRTRRELSRSPNNTPPTVATIGGGVPPYSPNSTFTGSRRRPQMERMRY